MDSPQDRVIKKMINNIVENNKPVFEKPVTGSAETESSTSSSSASQVGSKLAPEDYNLITRKLEYGFNAVRQDNAELRKQIDAINGAIKMLRNDMDMVRAAVQGRGSPHATPIRESAPASTSSDAPTGGAPQYRKSAADEAWESKQGGSSTPTQTTAPPKKDENPPIDISKVFYYGKK